MRRTILFLTTITTLCSTAVLNAQDSIVGLINEYGKFDRYCVRSVQESGIIGGRTKYLYEFYGDKDTTCTRDPFVSPDDYLWRTNNVLAVVAGVVKTNATVFPEERNGGYCARIETHIETVKALGIVNMDVVCQGAMFVGRLFEPIRDTKDPQSKVQYGTPFDGRPKALVFDYKADVGHTTYCGTGFSKLKKLDCPDYPEVMVILQKRWEDEHGKIHALRVGTGVEKITENADEWIDGHRLEIKYGDITSDPAFYENMDLNNNPDRAFYALNSSGKKVVVSEDGWADASEAPNYMIINFYSSCNKAFYGGVGNILWIDNVYLEM